MMRSTKVDRLCAEIPPIIRYSPGCYQGLIGNHFPKSFDLKNKMTSYGFRTIGGFFCDFSYFAE